MSRALDEFVQVLGQAQEELNRIQKALDNHLHAPDEQLNYGHVGDARRLVSDLRQINAWLWEGE